MQIYKTLNNMSINAKRELLKLQKKKKSMKRKNENLTNCINLFKLGLNQKQIAKKLNITEQTVGRLLKPIKARLKVALSNKELLHKKINVLLKENAPLTEVQEVIDTLEKYDSLTEKF